MVSEGRGFLCALGDSEEFPTSPTLGFDFTRSSMNEGCVRVHECARVRACCVCMRACVTKRDESCGRRV